MDTNENILIDEKKENYTENKKMKKPKKWKYALATLILVFSVMLLYVYFWTVAQFGKISFAQVIFHLVVPMEGANSSLVLSYFKTVVWLILFVLLVAFLPFIPDANIWKKYKANKNNDVKEKTVKRPKYGTKKINRFSKIRPKLKKIIGAIRGFYTRHFLFVTVVVLVGVIVFDVISFGIDQWLIDRFDSNTIFEDYYVDSSKASIEFPEEKKNLIIILAESLETSFADKENGGAMEENYIPNLTHLAKENTHFSSRENLQGATEVSGTSWTMASMVAQTSGVPLMLPIGDNSYGKYAEFLPGITSMGEILAKQGYNNELILGSKSEFAGIDTYFLSHGNYKIFDYYTAIEKGYIDEDYYEFWGFEDKKLFEYAKEEATELSKTGEPFSLIINSIDLHTPSGYLCPECGSVYSDKYKNVISCQDRLINDYVQWAKKQDFYEDTVIVIVGDHVSMAPRVEEEYVKDEDYERTTYNVIINSRLEATNNINRDFTTMDMYPTILAAIGCEIEGERLGIGTNLYSGIPTVMEEMGKEKFMEEISKNSILYNEEILCVE